MRELDKNCVYDLSELTSEEYRILFNWLLKNDKGWQWVSFEHWKNNKESLKYSGHSWSMCPVIPTHNAKELFYTLENIQVDCRELSEDQIKEMADVFDKSGIPVDRKYIEPIKEFNKTFLMFVNGDVFMTQQTEEKHTITYNKFMDLFAGSEQVEVNIEAEIKIVQFPEHYDNTNGSIYKFCNDQKLNSWEFDIIKRVVRCRKKGLFKEDLQKTKDLIDLYLKEFTDEK